LVETGAFGRRADQLEFRLCDVLAGRARFGQGKCRCGGLLGRVEQAQAELGAHRFLEPSVWTYRDVLRCARAHTAILRASYGSGYARFGFRHSG
jgi:hypothetical protein